MGKLTIRQKGKKFNVNIYSGNALAVFVYEYTDGGKEMYSLYDFFADKKHVSKIISNRKKLIDDDVVKIELNLWYKSARELLPYLVKNGYKVECYYFAMRNLIMFSDARFTGKSEAASLRKIDTDAAKYGADEEGWRMLGVLKQLIAESNISIDGKLCVWAEESAFRKAVNKACKESK